MPRLASSALLASLALTALSLRAQTGAPTSSQNQGVRPLGPNTQPPASGFVGTTLFAYGPTLSTDIALTRGDDNGEHINANATTTWVGQGPEGSSLAMNFGGRNYGSMWINTNGVLSFNNAVQSFSGGALNTPVIAPFFADIDNRSNPSSATPSGNIWYRTTQNAAELAAISTRVENAFAGAQNFTPSFAEIVTWDKVGRYIGGSSPDNLQVSTFQSVVASDGVRTFTLLLYPDKGIWWDRGAQSGSAFAAVGFAYADGTSVEVPGSRTASMRDLWFLNNSGTPGTFAFDVGGTPAPLVVNGSLTLPTDTGTATRVLQLGANPAGHTITSPAAAGSVLFNQLVFDNPANSVAFTDRVVALANAADAITHGNITFANNAVLVAQAAGSVKGGALTLKDNARLAIYAAGATTDATTLTFHKTSGTGGTLDLRGFDTALGAVNSTGAAAGVITNSGTTAATFTFGGPGTGNFNGSLQDGPGVLRVVKSGSGTQILTGANTHTGGTTVSAGTLQIGDGGVTGSLTGDITNHATLVFNRSDASTFAGAISGYGSVAKLGAGTLTLTGANTYTGGTTLRGGAISLQHASGLGTGALTFDGGTLAGAGDLIVALSGTVDTGGGTIHANPGFLTINGTFAGTGPLTKTGGNLLTFNHHQTYTGITTISGGTVKFGGDVAASALAIAAGGKVIFANSQTYAGAITGGGALEHEFSGTTILTGDATHTGGTAIIGGALQIGDGGATGSLTGDVTNNGALRFDRSDALTFAGAISGSGSLTKLGAGTLTLSGAGTYTGATSVSAGKLLVDGSLANTSVTVASGATLGGSGSIQETTTIQAGGRLAPGNSPGTLAFTDGLALAECAILDFELGASGDLIRVSGGTLSSTGTITVNLLDSGGFAAGIYTLIDAAGATLSSIGATSFDLGTVIAGYTYAFSQSDGRFLLTATAIPEPSAFAALAALAALGLASTRRRRRGIADQSR